MEVCDEINACAGVTVLVLGDGVMSALVSDAGADLGAIENAGGVARLTGIFYQASGGAATSATGSVKMAKLDGAMGAATASRSPPAPWCMMEEPLLPPHGHLGLGRVI
uniref:Uncharacterized protein n=1 Tax=Aegilops tauschii TaxID=37682 RepID=R7W797_AEGTA